MTLKITSPNAGSGCFSKYPDIAHVPVMLPVLARISPSTSRNRPRSVPVRPPTASASRNTPHGALPVPNTVGPYIFSCRISSISSRSTSRPRSASTTSATSARGGARLCRDKPDPSTNRIRLGVGDAPSAVVLVRGHRLCACTALHEVRKRPESLPPDAARSSCSATRLSLSSNAARTNAETGGELRDAIREKSPISHDSHDGTMSRGRSGSAGVNSRVASSRWRRRRRGELGGAAASRGGRGPSASSDVMVAREGGAAQARRVSPTSHVGCAPSSCHSLPPNRTRRTSDAGTSEEASEARARSSTSAGRSVGSPEGCTQSTAPFESSRTTCARVSNVRCGPTFHTVSAAMAVNILTLEAGTSAVSG